MYEVSSTNHEHHSSALCGSGTAAIKKAKERGFPSTIRYIPVDGSEPIVVASWCPLYGTKIINDRYWVP